MYRRLIVFILLTVSFQACTFFNNPGGELIKVDAKPGNGFMYPYYLFLPDNIDQHSELVFIVEPNNSGFASDLFQEHIDKAERTASKDFYAGNFISRNLKYPLLVPVFPRPESDWKIYTHALDRDVMLQKGNDLERLDLQLIAMFKDAGKMLAEKGFTVDEKFLMTGFSASGTFANRFSFLHPEYLHGYAAGGINGLLMLPVSEIDGKEINFPLGVNDFKELTGKEFNFDEFRAVPQLLFMGETDTNDAIPYEDGYDPEERELVFELLGEKMMPERWNKCIDFYNSEGINAILHTYKDTGHEQPDKIKQDILEFFIVALEGNDPPV